MQTIQRVRLVTKEIRVSVSSEEGLAISLRSKENMCAREKLGQVTKESISASLAVAETGMIKVFWT